MEVNRFAWWLLGCILHACMTCAFLVLRQTHVITQNQQQRYQWFNGWGKLTCLKQGPGATPHHVLLLAGRTWRQSSLPISEGLANYRGN